MSEIGIMSVKGSDCPPAPPLFNNPMITGGILTRDPAAARTESEILHLSSRRQRPRSTLTGSLAVTGEVAAQTANCRGDSSPLAACGDRFPSDREATGGGEEGEGGGRRLPSLPAG